MTDRHLNLFYTYNRDNELIENNLTRAWIVTLRMLLGETRKRFLQTLLEPDLHRLGKDLPSFVTCQFALQGYMAEDLLERIPQQYIITIATLREMEKAPGDQTSEAYDGSIPDAWIFDPKEGYCFLVEAKVGSNPLGARQVRSHAKRWLGPSAGDLEHYLIPLTWYDVLNVIQKPDAITSNPQEVLLLQEFRQYLAYFGYRLFTGFEFSNLVDAPVFTLTHQSGGKSTDFLDSSHL